MYWKLDAEFSNDESLVSSITFLIRNSINEKPPETPACAWWIGTLKPAIVKLAVKAERF